MSSSQDPPGPGNNWDYVGVGTRGGTNSRRSSMSSNSSSAFSQRIVFADFYTAVPIPEVDLLYSEFRGAEIRRIPVIRIFGATPKGQKTCTHIHGVFPYLYIPDDECIENLEHRLAFALDKGINSILNWSPNGTQHVYKVLRVIGRSFYGYKKQNSVFLKIYFYSPVSLKKAEELLQSGNILGKRFQPLESHIPFILQFFMDFKLYGMNFINFREIRFRRRIGGATNQIHSSSSSVTSNPEANIGVLSQTIWDYSEIPEALFLHPNVLRRSRCDLEIDVMAGDIIVSQSSRGKNPGIEAIWMDERERRRIHQIQDWANVTIPSSQDRSAVNFIFPRERELLDKLQARLQSSQSPKKEEVLVHTDSEVDNEDNLLPLRPTFSQTPHSSAEDYQFQSPPSASQTFLNEFEASSLQPSPLNSSENSQAFDMQVELNEEDNEIIAMLEDMARNRIEENDSIMGAMVDYDSEEDQDDGQDLSRSTECLPDSGINDSDEELKKWSQEYMTPEMFACLEEMENKASEESSSVTACNHKLSAYTIDQYDGQFDLNSSSSSDSSQSNSRYQKRRRMQVKLDLDDEARSSIAKLPLPCLNEKPKPSSTSSLSLKFRKERSRQCLKLNVMSTESGSQSSTLNLSNTSMANSSSLRDYTRTDVFRKSEPGTQDSDLVILETPSPLGKVQVDIVTLDSDSLDECNTPRNEKFKKTLSEPEVIIIDKSLDSGDDSSTASESDFTTSSHKNRKVRSKEKETVRMLQNETVGRTSSIVENDLELQDSTNSSQESAGNYSNSDSGDHSLGITSFYEYSQNSHSESLSDRDEIVEPIDNNSDPNNEDKWINSVYKYSDDPSDDEGEESEGTIIGEKSKTPLENISQHSSDVGQNPLSFISSSPQPINFDFHDDATLSDSSKVSSNEETSKSTTESPFIRNRRREKLRRRDEKEEELAKREKRRPSVFPCFIRSLKSPPISKEVKSFRSSNAEDGQTSLWTHLGFAGRLHPDLKKKQSNLLAKSALAWKNRIEGKITEPMKGNIWEELSELRVRDARLTSDNSSDDDDDVDIIRGVRPFRFAGGNGKGLSDSGSGSDFELSDNEKSIGVPSPAFNSSQVSPLNPPTSSEKNGRNSISIDTPKAGRVSKLKGRKLQQITSRRRLSISKSAPRSQSTFASAELVLPKFRPNDSELDSPSSRISESIDCNLEDLDASNFQNAKAFHEHQFLSTLAMEVHCASRDELFPDPECDEICGIFYGLHSDSVDSQNSVNVQLGQFIVGQLSTSVSQEMSYLNPNPSSIQYFKDEISMLRNFILLIHDLDPDILIGYEIQKCSWGYLIERGYKLGLNMLQELSRLTPLPFQEKSQSQFSMETWNESISGRIVLNLWKLLRHEFTATSYTFENSVFHILHERVHLLTHKTLMGYWKISEETRVKVLKYFQRRIEYSLRIIEKLDLINRTSELARLFGIQFFEVLSRGSQFRVESMMLRLAKPANLIPPSPNPQQRAKMKAPEYIPLIIEPESKFYTDPVAVLDFQSLYPSMMMAYNYCFSTCIGRVHLLGKNDEFDLGCLSQEISSSELTSLLAEDLLHISPCGVVFVKQQVKRGILGDMVEQILDTRQMVKRAMKKWKEDETLQRVLDSRQLGLKLIANVTYGYTSANYSGRMPCIEIADSVVSKGRETLQNAIDYVKENADTFGARVVYGDTDSLFVQFPGKSKAEAFVLAQKIVDDVTALNPKPVKLKLEKVYQPCILQTKKRYVGFAYETPDQKEPKYDAKGIETVRRDGCPAVAKILEGALKILFTTEDPSAVRKFVVEQFRKIFLGRVSLSKYTFARQYRGRMGYKPGACVAALEIAKKLAEKDRRSEPLAKERVPYIVVYGTPGSTLISRVRRPEEFIGNPNLRLDCHYYIEKAIIPALNRSLALAKLDVGKWYSEMPRKYLKSHFAETTGQKKGTLDQYFVRENCIKCDTWTQTGFCDQCFPNLNYLKTFLKKQTGDIYRKYESCMKTCRTCSGESEMICINMTCSIKHKFLRYDRDYMTKLPATIKLRSRVFGADELDW